MKGILPSNKWSVMATPSDYVATGSDEIFAEADTGGCPNGTIVLLTNLFTSSDIYNVEVWTSNVSDFATAGTALAAVASDGTKLVPIVSDDSNLIAIGKTDAALSDLSISATYGISDIAQDGMYVINVKGLARYVNVQFDNNTAGNVLACLFIGHDSPSGQPFPGKTTAY